MSAHAETNPRFAAPPWVAPRPVIVASLLLAAAGLVILFIGLLVSARRAWFAYLEAWTFGVSLAIGALVLLMAGHAAKAGWMVVTRRVTEAVVDALPLHLLLFVPIVFGLRQIYPWAGDLDRLDPLVRAAVEHKRHYLNAPFFIVRSFVYFAIFIAFGWLLRRFSLACDRAPSEALVVRLRRLGGGGLPVVALTLTWASFDWLMSLQPAWWSTVFGLYFFAGSFVGAIALVALMLHLTRRRTGPALLPVTSDHLSALGRLLFAMVIFWAYMAFSQLLIQWIGNIPAEVAFYRARIAGNWASVSALLVLGHFFAPFFLLLNRRWKRRPVFLASVAGWVLFMHLVDVYWLVMPAFKPGAGARPDWLDLGALLFVCGLSCAWIVHRYFGAPPIPAHVPELADGLDYESAL